ncbi:MAG: DUF4214 domain-containing protein [Methylococcales bacterium]|nr:DUF4214 domain-containing protein [Methylococcales bacterium]
MKKMIMFFLVYVCLYSSSGWTAEDCDKQTILKSSACTGDGIEAEELTLHKLVNEYRVEKGLPAIALSPALSIVANRHVQDLDKNLKKLEHGWSDCRYDSQDSATFDCMWKAPQRLGTSYKGNGYENAAFSSDMNAVNALTIWKNSRAHNDVILNQSVWKQLKWKSLGVGIYNGYAVLWFGDHIDSPPQSKKESTKITPVTAENIEDRIIELYSAYFNRAADKAGFVFWKKSFDAYYAEEDSIKLTSEKERNALQKITDDMANAEEYIALYPETQSSINFINAIYTNLLGRQADSNGLAFWANHIDAKTLTRGHAILNIIAGAKANKSTQGLADGALITNKTNVSKYFSKTLGLNNLKLAKSALLGVTHDYNTVNVAKMNLDSASKPTKKLTTEQQAVLNYHNNVRADVQVKKLTWSTEAAEHAQAWANNLASNRCDFEHSKDSNYGENLFKGSQGAYDMVDAAKSWEDEKALYKGEAINNDNFKGVGHYTQMVWSRTTGVGCATSTCNNQITVVCNYTPQGNMIGEKPF